MAQALRIYENVGQQKTRFRNNISRRSNIHGLSNLAWILPRVLRLLHRRLPNGPPQQNSSTEVRSLLSRIKLFDYIYLKCKHHHLLLCQLQLLCCCILATQLPRFPQSIQGDLLLWSCTPYRYIRLIDATTWRQER